MSEETIDFANEMELPTIDEHHNVSIEIKHIKQTDDSDDDEKMDNMMGLSQLEHMKYELMKAIQNDSSLLKAKVDMSLKNKIDEMSEEEIVWRLKHARRMVYDVADKAATDLVLFSVNKLVGQALHCEKKLMQCVDSDERFKEIVKSALQMGLLDKINPHLKMVLLYAQNVLKAKLEGGGDDEEVVVNELSMKVEKI